MRISGCLTRLLLWAVAALAFVWGLIVVLNPWALHIGGQTTPLLYWHGAGIVLARSGQSYPLYLWFSPDVPQRFHGIGRREGKAVTAHVRGRGYLCTAPGAVERMEVTGTMYGGYVSDADSLISFRLLEWRGPFVINPKRGFFDLAGIWRGQELVMDRPNEQSSRFEAGLVIDHAAVTLRPASYDEFEAACARAR